MNYANLLMLKNLKYFKKENSLRKNRYINNNIYNNK